MSRSRRRSAVSVGLSAVSVGLVLAASACSSSGAPSSAPASPVTPPPASAATSPPLITPSLSAADVSDNGLPSRVGAGKLSTPTIKRLLQYFEDKVSRAYATGDVNALNHYLAGPMLSGNRATIALLATEHKRNVFKIKVLSVKPQTNTAHQVIAEMTGDMTLNYFFNPTTRKVLDHGLPGPSQVKFVVFLNQNPKTGTWYWTGETAATSGSSTTGATQ